MEAALNTRQFQVLKNAQLTTSGIPLAQVPKDIPLVSIITINFNGAKTLEHTIQSVLALQYPFVEYILIDGGSSDDSLKIIDKYLSYLSYAHTGKDKGISDGFNLGIAKAQGDWIGIINADDWLEAEALQHLAPHFQEADILYGDLQYWNGAQKDYIYQANHRHLPKEMTMNHPSTFVKASVYKEIGAFQTKFRYAMDYDFLFRALKANYQFLYIPKVLANMRLAGVSDANWVKAYAETRDIKIAHGIEKFAAYKYFYLQCLRTYISRSIQKIGLNSLLSWYRKNFALIPKKQ